jgi:hypothetical protein
MATEAERKELHDKAEYLRKSVSTWVSGPRETRVKALADELDVLAGEKVPPPPDVGTDSGDGGVPA